MNWIKKNVSSLQVHLRRASTDSQAMASSPLPTENEKIRLCCMLHGQEPDQQQPHDHSAATRSSEGQESSEPTKRLWTSWAAYKKIVDQDAESHDADDSVMQQSSKHARSDALFIFIDALVSHPATASVIDPASATDVPNPFDSLQSVEDLPSIIQSPPPTVIQPVPLASSPKRPRKLTIETNTATLVPPEIRKKRVSKAPPAVPPLPQPHGTLIAVLQELDILVEAFDELVKMGNPMWPSKLPRIKAVARCLSLLSRPLAFQDSLLRHNGISYIASLAESIIFLLLSRINPAAPNHQKLCRVETIKVPQNGEIVLANINLLLEEIAMDLFATIQRCVDSEHRWRRYLETANIFESIKGVYRGSKHALDSASATKLATVCFRVLSPETRECFRQRPIGYALSIHALNIVASIMVGRTRSGRKIFMDQDGCQKVLGLIGWPSFILPMLLPNPSAGPSPSSPSSPPSPPSPLSPPSTPATPRPHAGASTPPVIDSQVLRSEFKLQLLALYVYNCWIHLSGYTLEEIHLDDRYLTVISQLFQWTSLVAHGVAALQAFASDETSYDWFAQPPVRPLQTALPSSQTWPEAHKHTFTSLEEAYLKEAAAMPVEPPARPLWEQAPPHIHRDLPQIQSIEVDLLFHTVYSFCVCDNEPIVLSVASPIGPTASDSEGKVTKRYPAIEVFFAAFAACFSNASTTFGLPAQSQLEQLRLVSLSMQSLGSLKVVPRIQIKFIEFVAKLMSSEQRSDDVDETLQSITTRRQVCLNVIESNRLWDSLFSALFYRWQPPASADGSIKGEDIFSRELRYLVTKIVLFAATIPGIPNVNLCRVVLRVISELHAASLDSAVDIIDLQRQIIKEQRLATQSALKEIQCLEILTPILQSSLSTDSATMWPLFALYQWILVANNDQCLAVYDDKPTLKAIVMALKREHEGISRFGLEATLYIIRALASVPPARHPEEHPTAPTAHKSPLVDMLSMFFECFPAEIQTEACYRLQMALLRGLMRIVSLFPPASTRRRRILRALLKARAFEYLLGVLSVVNRIDSPAVNEHSAITLDQRYDACVVVVQTLTNFMNSSDDCKKAFRDILGYDELRARIFVKGVCCDCDRLIDSFIAMMMDDVAPGSTSPRLKVMQNRDVVDFLLGLFPIMGEFSRTRMLEQFIFLTESHEMNQVLFTQLALVRKLLEDETFLASSPEHMKKVVRLIEKVALHSISITDTRLILGSLRHHELLDLTESETNAGTLPRKKPATWAIALDRKSADERTHTLPSWYDDMTQAFLNVALKKEADLDFFYFEGRESGIILPVLERWPYNTGYAGGYTICTWFKMDPSLDTERAGRAEQGSAAPPAPLEDVDAKVEPRIFSILNTHGNGVEIFVRDKALYLSLKRGAVHTVIAIPDVKIITQKWYFVAISHASPKLLWTSQTDLVLLVNGVVRLKIKVDFPDVDSYSMCRIGASAMTSAEDLAATEAGASGKDKNKSINSSLDSVASNGPHLDIKELIDYTGALFPDSSLARNPRKGNAGSDDCYNSFQGQMTSFYLFDDALTVPQLNSIYGLGVGHSSQFRVDDAMYYPSLEAPLFDGTVHAKLCLQYHPMASQSQAVCTNVAPKELYRDMDARLHRTLTCSTKCLRTAIHVLGGIEILLPLIFHFDMSTLEQRQGESDSTTSFSAQRVSTFFRLLSVLLADDALHQAHFLSIKGSQITSMLLQQVDPKHLTMSTLDGIMDLVNSVSENEQLAQSLHESFVFEFRLWACASFSVQQEYFEFLFQYLSVHADFRAKYGVAFFVDVLESFYWYLLPDVINTDLTKLLKARSTTTNLKSLRSGAIRILKHFIAQGISEDEASRIVRSIWTCTDEDHLLELMGVAMEFMLVPTSGLLENFLTHNGLDSLLRLWISCKKEATRVAVLHLLFVIIRSPNTAERWRRKARFDDLALTGASLHAVSSLFQAPTFTTPMYHALLQLALEEPVIDCSSGELIMLPTDLPGKVLRNSFYLHTIFHLLVNAEATVDLRRAVLGDLLLLCSSLPSNSERIALLYGWQRYFLNLIPECPRRVLTLKRTPSQSRVWLETSESTQSIRISLEDSGLTKLAESPEQLQAYASQLTDDPDQMLDMSTSSAAVSASAVGMDADEPTTNLVMQLISTVINDVFATDRRSWKMIEDILVIIWSTSTSIDSGIFVVRQFFLSFFQRIRKDVHLAASFNLTKIENLIHTVMLSEEIMFNHQDLREAVLKELDAMSADMTTPSERYQPSNPTEVIVRMSYPLVESKQLASECLSLLSTMIDLRFTLTDLSEKSHSRKNGLVLLALRLLLNALNVADEDVWQMVIHYIVPIIDMDTVFADMDDKLKHRWVFQIIGHIYDAFQRIQDPPAQRSDEPAALPCGETEKLDEVILPLYMLIVGQFRDAILALNNAKGERIITEEALDQAESSQERFLSFIASPEWTQVYDLYCFPAMKTIQSEDMEMIPHMTRRIAKSVRVFFTKVLKDENSGAKTYQSMESFLYSISKKRKDEETSRLSLQKATADAERRAYSRSWALIHRELTQERAIWYVDEGSSAPPQRWKLDTREGFGRMRRRLVPNFEFDDHRLASAKRDKSTVLDRASPSPRMSRIGSTTPGRKKQQQLEKIKSQLESGYLSEDILKELAASSAEAMDDESEDDEEWNVLKDEDLTIQMSTSTADSERFLCSVECEMILLMTAVKGRLELTTKSLVFYADFHSTTAELTDYEKTVLMLVESEVIRERRWPVQNLREMYLRRYMLRRSALEIFFVDQTSYLFNFPQLKDRTRLFSKIVSMRLPKLISADVRNPAEAFRKSDMTERWRRREISNFEYLMYLNTVSGRTYNDLTQYPVFPWILRDYTSDTIDLNDPNVYRDLSKPIGALDPTRLQQYLERYSSFEDPSGKIKKFMYGTHYSSAATTLYYLLRMEPFTSLHVALQGGKFDHPDRQFHSLERCWKFVLTGNGDVKELIPEFFYLPEFLINENKFDLGRRQSGEHVDDVILPPWASSAEEFIRIHREALEGDYVSDNLHLWIDLIWGYRQTGEEAVKAHNVFYYLTYEGAINIDLVKDPIERKSIEDQINNFGQTPSQLLKKPHPPRMKVKAGLPRVNLYGTLQGHQSYLIQLRGLQPLQFVRITAEAGSNANQSMSISPFSGLGGANQERIITVSSDYVIGAHKWSSQSYESSESLTFPFEPDGTPIAKRRLPSQFASNLPLATKKLTATASGKFIFSAGHWDSSFHITAVDSFKTVAIVYGHHDVVTCLALSEDESMLATGSRDTTVIIWDLQHSPGDGLIVHQESRRIMFGHEQEITAVAMSMEHDLVVSGSKDGSCILHTIYESRYLRTLRPATELPGDALTIQNVLVPSRQGFIVVITTIQPGKRTGVSPGMAVETSKIAGNHNSSGVELYLPPTPVTTTHPQLKNPGDSAAGGTTGSSLDDAASVLGHDRIRAAATASSGIHLYTVNGKCIRNRYFNKQLFDFQVSTDGASIVMADSLGRISVMKTHSLQTVHHFDIGVPALSLSVARNEQYMFVGRTDGKMMMITVESGKVMFV
ncbi:uncharacterized protein BJ171DRAFT_437728 [Polychytrium aggregatum]|uniref:uncharacterized protein n=1 Tax=Polychytrium aggregatum TaxID=110093 RepID=UPI0022FEC681|nr:uncharacterized protein BJ171DRAFT_437728 [Polychytrium aggregatum]KAI9209022.1 hypothetical protein BJ171DRAFT_437728 [Polychytrium aggregatum]